jgi:glycosyltransferase involved in cell wall biosynthesis
VSSILFVSPWLRDGGIERNLAIKVPWFTTRGYRVNVASWQIAPTLAGEPNPALEALRRAGAVVHRLGGAAPRYEMAYRALHLAALIVRTRSRVVVGHETQGNAVAIMAALLLGRVPRVIAELHNPPNDELDARTRRRLAWLYRRADGIVAVSETLARETSAYLGLRTSNVVSIHNPFGLEDIRQLAAQPLPAGAPPSPYIVACGRFVREKGFEDLIQAFALVARRQPLTLVLLGDGPLREALVRAAKAAGFGGRVVFPGFVTNPFAWFGRAAAFVVSSYAESFSRVLVEAMACGVPVVASRCQGPTEVLAGGAFGRLYDIGAVDQLAGLLHEIVAHPAASRDRVEAARARAEDFSDMQLMPRLAAFYTGRDDRRPGGVGERRVATARADEPAGARVFKVRRRAV